MVFYIGTNFFSAHYNTFNNNADDNLLLIKELS